MLRHTITVQHDFSPSDPIRGEFDQYIYVPFIPDMMIVRNIYYFFFGYGAGQSIDIVATLTAPNPDGSTTGQNTYTYAPTADQEIGSSLLYCGITDSVIGMIADCTSPCMQNHPLYFQFNGGLPVSSSYKFRVQNSDGSLDNTRGGSLLIILEFQKNISE